MARAFILFALCCAANAQNLLQAGLGKAFLGQTNLYPLQCQVRPLRAGLDFSFRFHTGYSVTVPLSQYRGPGHHWTIALRVQPETGAEPTYLEDRVNLPNVPDTDLHGEYGEFAGSFLAGEGLYQISFLLVDDQGRGCPAEWRSTVRRDSSDREVAPSIPPGSVLPTSDRSSLGWNIQIAAPLERLTVLLDAASGSPTRPKISTMQLEWLPPLLELARSRSIRLVAFSMDLQCVIYREERFTLHDLNDLRQAMFSTQIGVASVDMLRNPKGHIALLADLVKQELHSPEPSSAVLFLGATAWQKDKPSRGAVEALGAGAPSFFYLQYWIRRRPAPLGLPDTSRSLKRATRGGQPPEDMISLSPDVRSGPEPDTIEHLVDQLHGKTLAVHTPGDFAKAMKKIVQSTNPRPFHVEPN